MFESLLIEDFLYKKIANHYNEGIPSLDLDGTHGEIWKYRPNIEALLFDDISLFSSLIDKLIEQNDPLLFQAFLNCVNKTDLKKMNLFRWDASMQHEVLEGLDRLEHYGEALKKENSKDAQDKGELVVNITSELCVKIKEKTVIPCEEQTDKTRFENMQFKLQTVKELHREDKTLDIHRGWKRVAANVCSILFTGGLLNLANYLVTGNAFFCNQTETQKRVLANQDSLGFDSKEKFNFKPGS